MPDLKIYFPHNTIRSIQDKLIESVSDAIKKKRNLIVHAPTGLGKTAATLAPALTYAIKEKKTIFFLTSRHTQHKIAIDTLKQIREKYDLDFSVVDIIGKPVACASNKVVGAPPSLSPFLAVILGCIKISALYIS